MIRKTLSVFGVLALLLSVFVSTSGSVHASSASKDPLVIIAVDVTNQAKPCIETFKADTNTSHMSTRQFPCPAGTIISTKLVLRSQAIAQHDPYIHPSFEVHSSTIMQQINQLVKVKSSLFLASRRDYIHPLATGCGNNGSTQVTWSVNSGDDNFGVSSTESFYVLPNPNCNKVNLDTASMYVNYVHNHAYPTYPSYSWVYDLYAGGEFGVPGYPSLYANHSYSHSVNQVWPKGYYYEENIQSISSFYYWCNMLVN